ncbi:MAG: metallophosphoesterase [Lachnospiraceae bacterium]
MFKIICTIFAVLIITGIWVILYDTHHFVIRRYSFSSPKIKKAVKLVMLSDLHNYQYGRDNIQLLEAIEKEKPDAVVLTGDMITAVKKESFEKTLEFLKKINDKYPLYYAYGNHEQKVKLYPEVYGDLGERYEKALKEAGIEPLCNAHISLPEWGVTIYGLEIGHEYFHRFTTKPFPEKYLSSLLGEKDKTSYGVLLAHNPEYFPEYAEWGADLVLSGHIHGGIVRLPFLGGVISPAIRFFPKYDGGLFREGESHMALSRGIGTHSPNVRVFNPGELLVIELRTETGIQE